MAADTWTRDGVLYRVHPRTFADSDGVPRGVLVRQDEEIGGAARPGACEAVGA